MKLKQIEAILKKNKNVHILEWGEGQWLGDGVALYPVYGMPYLTEENLLTMWDIPESKRSSWHFFPRAELPGIDLCDTVPGEHIIERTLFPICVKGATVEPLKTESGAVFIDERYLRPFDNLENGYELYARTTPSGTTYIAVKSGYSLVGVIMPMTVVNEKFLEDLEALLRYSRITLYNQGEGDDPKDDGRERT